MICMTGKGNELKSSNVKVEGIIEKAKRPTNATKRLKDTNKFNF